MLRAFSTVGPRQTVHLAAHRAWSQHVSLGLKADLARLPPRREAKVPTLMRPVRAEGFEGFASAAESADEGERVELLQRALLCEGNVETLFIARSADGAPIYAQWLVDSERQDALHSVTGGLYPNLNPGETLVEGAYTFSGFRCLSTVPPSEAARESASSSITCGSSIAARGARPSRESIPTPRLQRR